MCGALHHLPLYVFLAWCLVKHRDNFTFLILVEVLLKLDTVDHGFFVELYQELLYLPVPVAARSKVRTVFDRSNTGIAGSNPARGMDVFPQVSVLCCPVCG
jgi:hypothetical protein